MLNGFNSTVILILSALIVKIVERNGEELRFLGLRNE